MRPLQKLVKDRIAELELGSLRSIADTAQKDGYQLSHSSLSLVTTGKYRQIKESTVAGLAYMLRLPAAQIREAAGLAEVGEEWKPPVEAHRLTYRQRRVVEMLIRELAAVDVRDRG